MKKRFLTSLYMLLSCGLFVLSGNPVYSQTTAQVEYLFPANKEKVINETVDEFYQALRNLKYPIHQEFYRKHVGFYKNHKDKYGVMDDTLFKVIPDASVNFRKKVLFHEVGEFNYVTWDGNGILTAYPNIKMNQAISPDRQVYVFYSFKDTDKAFRGRCAVYDVETKQLIAGEAIYMNKYLNEVGSK
ncbi:hypothetical protein J2Z40_003559 [Cytobacillus eiseniae]|uniref:Nuclear transport factor 2 family protein n=1 Tax=Cytobacillus eiseniae TaxID=762947 RepID=A0ABS4RJ99_9BACI|nr:hypothetical protein [Cytobacillus eiseniae]MBP2242977.1 hypothetical protein [Cytobacillus eiseniae]